MLLALRRHPFVATTFALAVVLVLWLLVEVASGLLGWHGRGEEPLRPWMTIGYVGRTHDLDPRLIDATAGFPTPDEAGHPLTLAEIAQARGVPLKQVFDELEAVLATLDPHHGPDRRPEPGAEGNGAAEGAGGEDDSETAVAP